MSNKDLWVVEVEKLLDGEITADNSHEGLIHYVPKSLLCKTTEIFYLPQVVSLGPYHFKKVEKQDDEMELLKTDAARKVHCEIKGGLRSREMVESGLKSVIECFKNNEEEIKGNYAGEFNVTGEVCAWMMARDACFVLQVLQKFGEVEDEDAERRESASIDRILSRKRHHPLLTEIVKDMFKMENQLPFWALKKIGPDVENWFESALKNLSPIEVADVGKNRVYKEKSHILQVLHDYIVDRPIPVVVFPDTLSGMGWPFQLIYWITLIVFSPFLFILFIIFVIQEYLTPKWEIREHSPTVDELKSLGVKFRKLEGKELGISHIKFKESNSTLYLPHIKVDNRSEVILRNLIALEICSREKDKPITRYVILMNDLINTSKDVGILRRADIITSKLGSDEEIAQFWNSMLTSTEMPWYSPIDVAVSDINLYRKKWWKVLWAQFVMTHCSKPWLFLSLLAGLTLLLLTTAQVVCLFASCQIK